MVPALHRRASHQSLYWTQEVDRFLNRKDNGRETSLAYIGDLTIEESRVTASMLILHDLITGQIWRHARDPEYFTNAPFTYSASVPILVTNADAARNLWNVGCKVSSHVVNLQISDVAWELGKHYCFESYLRQPTMSAVGLVLYHGFWRTKKIALEVFANLDIDLQRAICRRCFGGQI